MIRIRGGQKNKFLDERTAKYRSMRERHPDLIDASKNFDNHKFWEDTIDSSTGRLLVEEEAIKKGLNVLNCTDGSEYTFDLPALTKPSLKPLFKDKTKFRAT